MCVPAGRAAPPALAPPPPRRPAARARAGIPGKDKTSWAGATYRVTLEFSDEYPSKPPTARFVPPIFHPNIFPSGTVCLSILNDEKDWVPTITLKQVLLGIQDLLDSPNLHDPAQREAWLLCRSDRAAYEAKVRLLAKKYAETEEAKN